MEKVIFLDRDGTINEEVSYLHRPEDLVVLPGAAEGIALLKQAGFRVVVVTNQAGIARGYYAPDQMHRLHEYLNSKLLERGAWIDRFYYCPHHPVHGIGAYKKVCRCRKPDIGMFEAAALQYAIDKSRSYMIGDKRIDVEAGHRFGIPGILVSTGYGAGEKKKSMDLGEEPFYDFYAETLVDAAEYIIRKGTEGHE